MGTFSVRRTVKIPGGNAPTVAQLRAVLDREDVPDTAMVRTHNLVHADPEIVLWWDEDQP